MFSHSHNWGLTACALLVMAAAIRYVTRHHLPIAFDETMYLNLVLFDRKMLVDGGLLVFARKQVGTETWRPPAYRLAAGPVSVGRPGGPRQSPQPGAIEKLLAHPGTWLPDTLPRIATDAVGFVVFTRRTT